MPPVPPARSPIRGPGAGSLTAAAATIVGTDRGRALQLAVGAEQAIAAVTEQLHRPELLAGLVRVLGVVAGERALDVARTITSEPYRTNALADLARTFAAVDPTLAAEVARETEQEVRSLTDAYAQSVAMARLAAQWHTTIPEAAARLTASAVEVARGIALRHEQARALAALATTLPQVTPEFVQEAASAIADLYKRPVPPSGESSADHMLDQALEMFIPVDVDRAEQVARTMHARRHREQALVTVAASIATSDPTRAERLVSEISDAKDRASGMTRVALALAASDPGRAERMAVAAEQVARDAVDLASATASCSCRQPRLSHRPICSGPPPSRSGH